MNLTAAKRFVTRYDSQDTQAYDALSVSIDTVQLDVRGSARSLQIVSDVFRTHVARSPLRSGAVAVTLGEGGDPRTVRLRADDVAMVCDRIMRAFYETSSLMVVDGAVVVRGDEAVCLIGDRPDVAVALAGALLARGWRLFAAHQVLIDVESCTLRPFHRALRISSSRLGSLTPELRAACERSPWYVAADGEVVFYGIDPATQLGTSAWSSDGRLTRILYVDDAHAIVPTIHGEDSWDVLASVTPRSRPVHRNLDVGAALASALRGVRGGRIRVGQLQDAAEAVDSWADA